MDTKKALEKMLETIKDNELAKQVTDEIISAGMSFAEAWTAAMLAGQRKKAYSMVVERMSKSKRKAAKAEVLAKLKQMNRHRVEARKQRDEFLQQIFAALVTAGIAALKNELSR